MEPTARERFTVSTFYVWVLIHSSQYGLGYLSMSILPVQIAGQDAWMSVLISAAGIHFVIWIMYGILNRRRTDLIHIHRQLFGRWGGDGLNLLFLLYFLFLAVHHTRVYIEIVQVWLFPDLGIWPLAIVLLLLVYYIVSGGMRVVVGICAFSLITQFLALTLMFSGPYFQYRNLFPIFDHSLSEMVMAARHMTFSYMGVELLLFYYTFIKDPEQSQAWAHAGNAATTITYLLTVLFSLLLFNPEQLAKEVWPVLTKFKFVQFPFFERFEFMGASIHVLRMLPIVCLSLWAASRIMKMVCGIRQMTVLPLFLAAVFTAVCLFPGQSANEAMNRTLSGIGSYLLYGYIPLLYIVHRVRWKARNSA